MTVDAQEFLDTVFADVPEGETVLIAKQRGQGFSNTTHPGRAFESWLNRGKAALYFNIATVRVPDEDDEDDYLRRRSEDCQAVYCMVLDDINEDGCFYKLRKGKEFIGPPIKVEPSWILETSPGNFQWGYIIDPTEELSRFSALMDTMADAMYTDGGAKGFNRLMRIPGSVNTKPGRDNFKAVIHAWNPDLSFGTVDDLAQAFDVEIGVVKARERHTKVSAMEVLDLEVDDPVADWMFDNAMVIDDDDEWLTIECPNCDSHTTGDDTARYSPLGRGGDKWQMQRGFKCFHEHCADFDFLGWVKEHGGPFARRYDPIPFLQQRYTYIQEGRRICDMQSLSRGGLYDCSLDEFSDIYAHMNIHMPTPKDKKRYVKVKTAFMEEENTPKVRRYDVIPHTLGEKKYAGIIIDEVGEKIINTYRPPAHDAKPSEKSLEVFLRHINYLLPDNTDNELFLDWLAFKLQNPRKRSYGVVMVAEDTFGVGRSWLGDVLRAVWTSGNVQAVDIGDLTGHGASSGFNDWASGSQVVIIEEAHDSDNQTHFKAYERIKTLVDPRVTMMQINAKYGSKRQERVWFNLLVFSNHADAFNLPRGERRLAVYANPTQKLGEDYYTTLWNTYSNNPEELASAVYKFLIERDVSKFKHSTPPETEAKKLMIERSAAPGQIIADVIKERAQGELVTRHMLFDLWEEAERCEHLENSITNNMQRRLVDKLWQSLPRLGSSEKNGFRSRARGGQPEEIRALRRSDHWRRDLNNGSPDAEMIKGELAKSGRGIGFKRWSPDGIEML